MKKKYKIKQYSTVKPNIDLSLLSTEQIKLRLSESEPEYKGETRRCKMCLEEKPITEYYVKVRDKKTGEIKRRATLCRDCILRKSGVKEVGKRRFAKAIFDKNFRRCSVCKDIKPLQDFSKNRSRYGGYANNCYECSNALHHYYIIRQRENFGDFYIREYGKRNYNLKKFTPELIEKLKRELIELKKPKYFLDGKEFIAIKEFARYLNKKYGISTHRTESRIRSGYTEDDCLLSENEIRSRAYTKGRIKVVDTVSNKVFVFNNTKDERLMLMFSKSTITSGIKTGKPTRITSLSKYKNPCIIKRI